MFTSKGFLEIWRNCSEITTNVMFHTPTWSFVRWCACVFSETTAEISFPPISQDHAKDYLVMFMPDSAGVFSSTTADLLRLTKNDRLRTSKPTLTQTHTHRHLHTHSSLRRMYTHKYTPLSHNFTSAPCPQKRSCRHTDTFVVLISLSKRKTVFLPLRAKPGSENTHGLY